MASQQAIHHNSFPATFRSVKSTPLPASQTTSNLRHGVRDPSHDLDGFFTETFSLAKLEKLQKHFWLAGAPRPASPLHQHLFLGRRVVITERLDMHLLWESDGLVYIKPLPRYLLEPETWTRYLTCPSSCACNPSTRSKCPTKQRREIALGFLYSYACLISYESDFELALNGEVAGARLLPFRSDEDGTSWAQWKVVVSDLLATLETEDVHARFLHAELRLSRLNKVHRFTQWPLFQPYNRRSHSYGDLFRNNMTWLATSTIFIALVLTAMQVGMGTPQLAEDEAFMNASYGFTVFSIVGPLGVVALVFVAGVYNFLVEVPRLVRSSLSKARAGKRRRGVEVGDVEVNGGKAVDSDVGLQSTAAQQRKSMFTQRVQGSPGVGEEAVST
ncbi:hypothetical protein B0T19DRAFT_459783 [Cercophora scortea]|uniref:Uncharacterized protein n=1 Tax=Cercophora scortea TaxID=314031 RepID=A0AAE0MIS5_9PEZI|nr:hypothetical protein B0T19DRAFT_459783 [Cercophora scortea]